ncbi:AAA family ATPase [Candidatus Peregrinibacteria bacterium]|nr:AAA family ATPase [Candidatus Peregrinibacteria bacterium]
MPKDTHTLLRHILGQDVDDIALPPDVEERAKRLLRMEQSPQPLAEWAYLLRREIYDMFHQARREREGRDVIPVQEVLKSSPALQTKLALYRLLLRYRPEGAQDSVLGTMTHHWERHQSEKDAVNGRYEQAKNLLAERDVLQKELMDVFARIFAHRDSHADSVDIAERDVLESEISTIEKRVAALKNEEPAVAAMLQYDELQQRLREQREGGFMQFPSRRKIVHDMMAGLLSDTPLAIMYGESGVGKTAIAKQLAPTLGVPITVHTGGGDRVTPFQNLLFSREIDAQRGTYIAYGPLLQAMTGYADSRMEQQIHRGAIFFDAEFNTRPSGMQREILKFVAKAKPGSTIDVTGRNLRVTVQPGFVYVAAGNPPGSRYQRDVTPQEAYREVATKCFVDYLDQSPDNPELFTTMVVGLLDEKTGRSRIVGAADIMPAFVRDPSLGREVLDPDPRSGGFLWRFANAWKQTLNARYPDREGELLLKKEDPTAAEGTY